jgi:hypothetical protein
MLDEPKNFNWEFTNIFLAWNQLAYSDAYSNKSDIC